GPFGVPYASRRFAKIISGAAADDVQCVPAIASNGEPIAIVNLLHLVDCFDYCRSVFTRSSEGKVNMVLQLRLDESRTEGRHAFRVKGWRGPFIVSSEVVGALEQSGLSGFVAEKVS